VCTARGGSRTPASHRNRARRRFFPRWPTSSWVALIWTGATVTASVFFGLWAYHPPDVFPEIDPLGFVSLGEPSSFNWLFIVSLFFAWLFVLGVGLGVILFVAYRYDRITTRRAINEITGTPRRSGQENNQLS
jgi:hypothetical protein